MYLILLHDNIVGVSQFWVFHLFVHWLFVHFVDLPVSWEGTSPCLCGLATFCHLMSTCLLRPTHRGFDEEVDSLQSHTAVSVHTIPLLTWQMWALYDCVQQSLPRLLKRQDKGSIKKSPQFRKVNLSPLCRIWIISVSHSTGVWGALKCLCVVVTCP